jgi:large subunit ribosomal protein L17
MVPKLFGPIRERYLTRPGGYTRVLRIEPMKEDQAESAILELVDGPKDMRFAMTAKTLARLPPTKHLNDLTAKNVKRVTQFREGGMSELQEMVQEMRIQKDEGIDDRILPAPKKVYPYQGFTATMHYPEEVGMWQHPNPLPKKLVKKEVEVVEPEDDFVVAERSLGKEVNETGA